MNEEQSLAQDIPELADAIAWFSAFAAPYRVGGPDNGSYAPLELKVRHTCAVTRVARKIVDSLDLPAFTRRAALLAALFHDVGRFPQFVRWKTFRDADSVNHGTLGARTLAGDGLALRAEDPAMRRLVIGAVALHNRYKLPCHVPEELALVTNIVRDADKIDILRIFAAELRKPEPSPDVVLHVAREPEKWSPHIADMLLREVMPDYRDLRYVNDFAMLLCSWPGSLCFARSRSLVSEEGTLEELLSSLPAAPELEAVKALARARVAADGGARA